MDESVGKVDAGTAEDSLGFGLAPQFSRADFVDDGHLSGAL